MTDLRESVLVHREQLRDQFSGSGLTWLDQLRDDGAARFAELGLPNARDENWRYTNLRKISRDFPLPALGGNATAAKLDTIAGFDSHRLSFIDGVFDLANSNVGDLPAGVTVASLRQVLEQNPEQLEALLGAQISAESGSGEDGLRALNTAFLNDGAVILVPDNMQLQKPIELIFATSENRQQTTLLRNVLSVGRGASASVVERYVGAGGAKPLTHAVSEVSLADNAALRHVRIQDESDDANHLGGTWVGVGRDGRYYHTVAAIGGALMRHDLQVRLNDRGAHCQLHGLVLGADRRHVDNHTTIEHVAPHCTSDEHYRSVLNDRSRSIFHGRIRVHKDAQKTDAHQLNKSLLLSDDAEADSKPQLEIYADDVKCSHGATIGQLDENSKFYLRSRGIDSNTAQALLTLAFAQEVLTDLGIEAVRQYLAKAVIHRLIPNALIDETLIDPAGLFSVNGDNV